jgi:hypothetical protein
LVHAGQSWSPTPQAAKSTASTETASDEMKRGESVRVRKFEEACLLMAGRMVHIAGHKVDGLG